MRIFVFLLATLTFVPRFLVARDLFILTKAGESSYGSLYLGILPGDGRDTDWRTGLIICTGIRVRTSTSFAVEALVEYSTHRPRNNDWANFSSNNPRNTLVDLAVIGRSSLQIVEPVHCAFLYGLGLSYQHKDGFGLAEPGGSVPATNAMTGIAIVGVGLEVRTPSRVEFSLEGSLHCRQYVTPVAIVGIAYLL